MPTTCTHTATIAGRPCAPLHTASTSPTPCQPLPGQRTVFSSPRSLPARPPAAPTITTAASAESIPAMEHVPAPTLDPRRVVTSLDPNKIECLLKDLGILDQAAHIVHRIRHGFDVTHDHASLINALCHRTTPTQHPPTTHSPDPTIADRLADPTTVPTQPPHARLSNYRARSGISGQTTQTIGCYPIFPCHMRRRPSFRDRTTQTNSPSCSHITCNAIQAILLATPTSFPTM